MSRLRRPTWGRDAASPSRTATKWAYIPYGRGWCMRGPGAAAGRATSRGFTIIEVIVATFLLTVGLVATSQLVLVATGQVALSQQQSVAATLAAQTVEQYRDVNFSTLGLGCDPVAGCTYTQTPTVGAITYTVSTNVKPNNPVSGVTLVSVAVTWGSGNSYGTSTILSPLQ